MCGGVIGLEMKAADVRLRAAVKTGGGLSDKCFHTSFYTICTPKAIDETLICRENPLMPAKSNPRNSAGVNPASRARSAMVNALIGLWRGIVSLTCRWT
jgi:hypothetical protein